MDEDYKEYFQNTLDISKTLIRSREVVDQSKRLLNKIKSCTDLRSPFFEDLKKYHIKSLDQSFIENSQVTPTLSGYDFEVAYQKENNSLLLQVASLTAEVQQLKKKLIEKDLKIAEYEEKNVILDKEKPNSKQPSKSQIKPFEKPKKKFSVKMPIDSQNEKDLLEQRLVNITKDFNKQVSINFQLKKKIQEFSSKNNSRKISEIEEKIISSHQGLKNLSKRLEKTEAILSTNVTPTRLEICSFSKKPAKLKSKKSCVLINHQSKKLR